MNLIPCHENFDASVLLESFQIVNELNKKYNTENFVLVAPKLCNILKFGNIKNKTILDLGCGSIYPEDFLGCRKRTYEPWLARALYEKEANVIGVDIGDLFGEKFTHYQVDLTEKDSLNFIDAKSADIACAFSLFDSSYIKKEKVDLFNLLLPQLERIVKPEGHFIFDTTCSNYRKF